MDIEPEKRVVAKETVMDWCAANGNLPFVETSAKESTNVVLAFQSGVEKWAKLDGNNRIERPYNGQTVSLTSRRMTQQDPSATASSFPCCQ